MNRIPCFQRRYADTTRTLGLLGLGLLLAQIGPARAQTVSLPLFKDDYTSGWSPLSGGAPTSTARNHTPGGTTSLILSGSGSFPYGNHLVERYGPYPSDVWGSVTYWVYATASGQTFSTWADTADQDGSVQYGYKNFVNHTEIKIGDGSAPSYLYNTDGSARANTLVAGQWVQVRLPLTVLGVNNTADLRDFDAVATANVNSSNPLYFDDVVLVSKTPSTAAAITVNANTAVKTTRGLENGTGTYWWGGVSVGGGVDQVPNNVFLADAKPRFIRLVPLFPTSPTSVGTNTPSLQDFGSMIEAAGAVGILQVDYGADAPWRGAAEVAYYRGNASDTHVIGVAPGSNYDYRTVGFWASLRGQSPLATDDGFNALRANHPAVYNVTYYHLGNEEYFNSNDPTNYGHYLKQMTRTMKAVDSTIKVGMCIDSDTSNWDTVIYNICKDSTTDGGAIVPDFVDFHNYAGFAGGLDQNDLLDLTIFDGTGSVIEWKWNAQLIRSELVRKFGAGGSAPEIICTENNVEAHQNLTKQSVSLVRGLILADSVGQLLQSGFSAMCWFDWRNGLQTLGNGYTAASSFDPPLYGWRDYAEYGEVGSSTGSPYPSYFRGVKLPTYFATKLCSKLLGNGDSAGGTVIAATSDNPFLAVYAVKRTDGSVNLLVINKSENTSVTGTFTLNGYTPAGSTATLYQYGKTQDNQQQNDTLSTGTTADLAQSTLGSIGPTFAATFPGYSMSVIALGQGGGGVTTPAAPTGLQATAGNAQAVLSWNASTGATSYRVKRATTSGGSYTTVQTALAATTFTDTGLTNGTAYYYVVTAVNSAGESGASNQASATPQAPAITSTLTPFADAYVRNGVYAGTNYGSSPDLIVKNDPTVDWTRHTYLTFDVSALTGTVQSAKLRVYGSLTGADTLNIGVYGVGSTTWSESGLTWNNAPAPGSLLNSQNVTNTTGLYTEWDITAYLQAQKTAGATRVSLELAATAATANHQYYGGQSKEGANTPQLVIITR